MKYWNINGYGYDALDNIVALSKYGKDFIENIKVGESKHIVITRITKKEFESYQS